MVRAAITTLKVFFKNDRRLTPKEIERNYQISKSSVPLIGVACSGMSGHRKLYFRSKDSEPNFRKLFPAIGSHFPLYDYKIVLYMRDIFYVLHNDLVTFYLHNSIQQRFSLGNPKICLLISQSTHLIET